MLILVAALVTLACVGASLRRLWIALAPTAFDPALLAKELRGEGAAVRAKLERILEAFRREPAGAWERDLLEAATKQPSEVRTALVNEQLLELDGRQQQWARVPRVCASIATSTGFLLASLALREGLSRPELLSSEVRGAAVESAVLSAINVAALGLVGTVFCIAIQGRAKKAVRERQEATEKLVERLESIG